MEVKESQHHYVYHHGSGKHILAKDDTDVNRPKYSFRCCLCYCVDGACLAIIVGFLIFAFWLPYYVYNNYGDGGR
jgi:hypothetical protein